MKRMNLTGHRFGRLIALRFVENEKKGTYWLCRCDCGNENEVFIGHLRSGKINSCGCLLSESVSTHRKSRTPEHIVWCAMRNRCLSKKTNGYQHYGGMGVKICSRWDDFDNFLEDMGPRPSQEHTLDRIDPFGDYEPSNCKWSTKKEQARNRRTSKRWHIMGKVFETAQDAADHYRVTRLTIRKWCDKKEDCWTEYLWQNKKA